MEWRNGFVTMTVFMLFGNITGLSMNNVCSTNDNTCKTPSISGVGLQKWGKCSKTGVLLRFQEKTLLECGQECLLTAECTSINYRSSKNLCDIVSSTSSDNDTENDSTCFNIDISNWHKSLAGKCADHTCAAGTKCIFDTQNGNTDCASAYCTGLPATPNAEIVEWFGLYRNFDLANKYKCQDGYLMIGRHFAICRATGTWDVLFSCIEGGEFNKHRYFFPREVMKWDDAKKHCEDLSASLVAIGSDQENSWIREQSSIHYENVTAIWTGLKNVFDGLTYVGLRWHLNGNKIKPLYTNWGSDQPTRLYVIICVRMNLNDGTWHTQWRQTATNFVCEQGNTV